MQTTRSVIKLVLQAPIFQLASLTLGRPMMSMYDFWILSDPIDVVCIQH